ncbi:hypothetical protein CG723_39215 [Streptomyces sp. CB01635]|uniref:hypothetical protein n=1 Tax=unclassified Streptomyces TaxID=2593676 RepID=UPI000C26EED6|nr:hypothetical protein [Streptomyces sp. CB01635]PJN06437.1 hypothetical protein CG723_39215 [Streptomyces sp. CB01635]
MELRNQGQLCADRPLTSLRRPLHCEAKTTAVRHGPAAPPGFPPGWLLFLCPKHADDLPGWPGSLVDAEDPLTLSCGAVLDFRSTEEVLQSHADLWLTPLTGVDTSMCIATEAWPDVLDQAHRVLGDRQQKAGGESQPLGSLTGMLGMPAEYAKGGGLYQATVPLGCCETVARKLL